MMTKMIHKTAGVAAILLACAGCHRQHGGDGQETATNATQANMPLARFEEMARQRHGNAATARMSVLAGRWESASNAVTDAGGHALSLTLRNDGGFTLELRGAIGNHIQGVTRWEDDGTLSGMGSGARPPIAGLARWRATFPRPATMRIKGSDGRAYDLKYRGSA